MHPTDDVIHDLREGAALAKGWLETLFRHWEKFDEVRKREMVAAALLGANEVAVALERMEGREPEQILLPQERMAEEFLRLEEVVEEAAG